ncbi:MAG: hypothetical protein HQL71_01900 [Magnetococcales bacterium]|nr:hypothetical protein [Magnetococcales bacterium]
MNLEEIIALIMDIPSIVVGIFTKGMHTIIAGVMPLIVMALIVWIILKYLGSPKKTKPTLEKDITDP